MFDRPARARFRASVVGPVGLAVVLLSALFALVVPFFVPDPTAEFRSVLVDGLGMPQPPLAVSGHLLGGDSIGRDLLARLAHGGRISLSVAVLAAALSTALGVGVGVTAGYVGGKVDAAALFFCDVLLSMPFLLVVMCARKVLPSDVGIAGLVLLLGTLSWPGLARIVRARTPVLRELDYVTAARAMGASGTSIVLRHVVPNLTHTVVVYAAALVAGMMLTESSLSFLGLGVPTGTPSWGSMLEESRERLFDVPRLFVLPALPLVGGVLGFHLLGQGLRDAFDVEA